MQGKAWQYPTRLSPLAACELLLIGELIGTPASSAAMALLVVFRNWLPRQRPLMDRKK